MKITLLYGTESGNAAMLCDDLMEELAGENKCAVSSLADIAPEDLDSDTFYIFVTSTHGSGDVPATAAQFFEALEANQPDLSGIRFSIFGLGDRVFAETFNQGSEKLMQALLACNATLIGERGLHDASTGDMPEDIAIPWIRECMAALMSSAN